MAIQERDRGRLQPRPIRYVPDPDLELDRRFREMARHERLIRTPWVKENPQAEPVGLPDPKEPSFQHENDIYRYAIPQEIAEVLL